MLDTARKEKEEVTLKSGTRAEKELKARYTGRAMLSGVEPFSMIFDARPATTGERSMVSITKKSRGVMDNWGPARHPHWRENKAVQALMLNAVLIIQDISALSGICRCHIGTRQCHHSSNSGCCAVSPCPGKQL
jgi:hypothetical protein